MARKEGRGIKVTFFAVSAERIGGQRAGNGEKREVQEAAGGDSGQKAFQHGEGFSRLNIRTYILICQGTCLASKPF